MLSTIKVRIAKHEIGLRFRYADYRGILRPGIHWLPGRLINAKRDHVQVFSTLAERLEHPLLGVLVRDQALADMLEVVDLAQSQRALVWIDGRLRAVLGPGKSAFWKHDRKVQVEVYDVETLRLEHAKMEAILAHPDASRHLQGVDVGPHECVLLSLNGRLIETLGQGRHVYWRGAGRVELKAVDLREKVLDVAGQEILSADKVTLRLNLVVAYRVADPVRAVTVSVDADQALYREAQLALRAAVGTRTLDALLAGKEAIGAEVRAAVVEKGEALGLEGRSVGVRDIILPGDMKAILNQVITAEKAAQAELIKRREETAAARSQANTARLLAESPMLARFKELEMLKDVLAGASVTFVMGQGDLADQVRGLVAGSPKA